ncbi:hypothetical protein MesoLj113a_19000 [Mesorhizobium sp. 113-1-2]|uniref:hypothetical protein n=1 Tax=Mesorhizobium sp. 113-1-2 TaxID=2744515 RepID=UPI001927CCE5|nr:hypothetical protein [Mesorhizobium sp. 113-1-2]BCG70742.1 hypothetical protein MesoLj113a_19000 [Mesorhizobium sp. 113-1-2]
MPRLNRPCLIRAPGGRSDARRAKGMIVPNSYSQRMQAKPMDDEALGIGRFVVIEAESWITVVFNCERLA